MRGNELGCSGGQLNDEMEFIAFDTALTDGEDLTAEGMVWSRNAYMLDVTGIQPRSMLVVVPNATKRAALC